MSSNKQAANPPDPPPKDEKKQGGDGPSSGAGGANGGSKGSGGVAWLKETTAAMIAAAMVAAFLWTLHGVWTLIGTPDRLAAGKELLQTVTGFVGVVAGYYFGRVPAERTADAAQKQAEASRGEAATARRSEDETRRSAAREVRQALDHLSPRGPVGGSQLDAKVHQDATSTLQALLAQLESR